MIEITTQELIKYWSKRSLVFKNFLMLYLLCFSQTLRSWRLITLPSVLLTFSAECVKCMRSYFSHNSQLKDYRWSQLPVFAFLWYCCISTVVFCNLSNNAEDGSFFFYPKINCMATEWSAHKSISHQVRSALWSVQTGRLTLYPFLDPTSLAFFSLSHAYKKEL